MPERLVLNLIQKFNYFGTHEVPNIWLCNPNKKRLFCIRTYTDSTNRLRFNEMSELELSVPKPKEQDELQNYNKIESKRLLEVETVGYFLINNVTKEGNGIEEYKTIQAYSLECELQYKKVVLLEGTYKFYDLFEPENTLMGLLFDGTNNWKIGKIDPELMNSYRTFSVPDATIYSFLLNDVEQAYECIFTFDTYERTVNAYYLPNYLKKTDIFLTYDNLLENVEIVEEAEQICTSLKVYGSEIDIRAVNPTGQDAIYDFSYYMNTDWMQQELIDALNSWISKCEQYEEQYKEILLNIKNNNIALVTKEQELVELQTEWDSLEGVMSVRVQAGQSISDIKRQMDAKQAEIDTKQKEINDLKKQIEQLTSDGKEITENLLLENNITGELWEELSCFIIQNTYQNDQFVVTSVMTEAEKQTVQEELLAMGQEVLSRVSHPRYTFQLDTNNFIYLKEFLPFTNQLELGAVLNIRNNEEIVTPILLEIEYSFSDPTKLTLTFGNRYKLDSSEFEFADLFGDAISGGTSVKFDSTKWGEWVNSGAQGEVTQFINSQLDASRNNIINQKNQNFIINQNGLRGRKQNEDGSYGDKQCWLTNDTLAFTKDNWSTASLALGRIQLNEQELYGIVKDAIYIIQI